MEWPITLRLKNGPWLYQGTLSNREKVEVEVGVFLERLFRLTIRERCRRTEWAWTFEGYQERGRSNGFIHVHGILTTHDGCRLLETLSKKDVYLSEGVSHIHCETPLTEDTRAGWRDYMSGESDDVLWYRVHKSLIDKDKNEALS
jgi:hypothetical protein